MAEKSTSVYLRMPKGFQGSFYDPLQRKAGMIAHEKIGEFAMTANVSKAISLRRVEEVSEGDYKKWLKENPKTDAAKGAEYGTLTHANHKDEKQKQKEQTADANKKIGKGSKAPAGDAGKAPAGEEGEKGGNPPAGDEGDAKKDEGNTPAGEEGDGKPPVE